jgi:hypothetical protein
MPPHFLFTKTTIDLPPKHGGVGRQATMAKMDPFDPIIAVVCLEAVSKSCEIAQQA